MDTEFIAQIISYFFGRFGDTALALMKSIYFFPIILIGCTYMAYIMSRAKEIDDVSRREGLYDLIEQLNPQLATKMAEQRKKLLCGGWVISLQLIIVLSLFLFLLENAGPLFFNYTQSQGLEIAAILIRVISVLLIFFYTQYFIYYWKRWYKSHI